MSLNDEDSHEAPSGETETQGFQDYGFTSDSSLFTYQPRERAVKQIGQYVLGDLIGEGAYSRVREAICSITLRRVAIKIMKRKRLRRIPGGEANVKREIEILKKLKHTNIIELHHVLYNEEKQKIYVVMEYCVTGLQALMERAENKCLPIWQAHDYFCQLMKGLEYLHSHGIVHRDIKPGNILLTKSGELKISDFGVAEQLSIYDASTYSSSSSGSPAFQPPEIANGQESFSGFKVDVWACGVTLYNMVSGGYPFTGTSLYHLFQNIATGEYILPQNINWDLNPDLADIIRKTLSKNADERPNTYEVLKHQWIISVPIREGNPVPLLQTMPPVQVSVFAPNSFSAHSFGFNEANNTSTSQHSYNSSHPIVNNLNPINSGRGSMVSINSLSSIQTTNGVSKPSTLLPPTTTLLPYLQDMFPPENLIPKDKTKESKEPKKFGSIFKKLSLKKKKQLDFRDFLGSTENLASS